METRAAFPARLFRRIQDALLLLDLSFQLCHRRFLLFGLSGRLIELFMLAVHDELRFRAISQERLESLLKIGNHARLMVHDLLDLPTIGQKRIEPDLARFERSLRAHRFIEPGLRLDSFRGQPVRHHQFLKILLPLE